MQSLSARIVLFATLLSTSASAAVRVWERNADNPDTQQFLDVGGFVQPGLVWRNRTTLIQNNSHDNDSGFYLQRARIGFKAQFSKYFLASFEYDGTGPSLNDVYLESRVQPWLVFRGGQFLVPFLQTFQFNEVNTSLNDRPLYVPQDYSRPFLRYLSPRDVGFMVFGDIGKTDPTSSLPMFEYRLGIFNGAGQLQASNPDRAFLYSARFVLHALGAPVGRASESDLARNPTPKVALGLAGYMNCDNRANWNRGYTVDGEFRFQGIYASASWVSFRNGPAGTAGAPFGYGYYCKGGQVAEHNAAGISGQLQYVFPESLIPVSSGALELLARGDFTDPFMTGKGQGTDGYVVPPAYDDTDNAPARWRLTLGANWYPLRTQALRVSLNYQHTQQTEPLENTVRDTPTSAPRIEEILLSRDLVWIQLTAGI